MTLETIQPLKVRLDGQNRALCAGKVVTIMDHLGWNILARVPKKIRRVDGGPCFSCSSTRRWLSVHGAVICSECHPPASPCLVLRWIE